jgi:hypothetical protein
MRVKLDLQISSEGAAFQDGMHGIETARILRALADVIFEGSEGYYDLRDLNGAYSGRAVFEAWEEED